MTYTYINKDLDEMMSDLADYTKIPIEIVRNLVLQREPFCYKREFVFQMKILDQKPNRNTRQMANNTEFMTEYKASVDAHQDFFYISSAFMLFGNAKHGLYIDDISKLVSNISNEITDRKLSFFEFGGGCGQMSLAVKKANPDINVYFNEISAIQKDFFLYRCHKNNIHDISLINSWEFDKPLPRFDIVTALDVFEHIKNYPKYINKICDSINKGGYLFEGSYFLENFANDVTHCVEDKYNLHGIIKSRGFELQSSPKMSEGNLWKKIEE